MAASELPSGATMRRATTADIPAIASVYMDSFSHDIFSRQVFPRSASSSMTYWTPAVQEEMAEDDAVWFVVTEPVAGQQEAVQAFVKWTRPGAPFPDPDAADVYPPEGNPALAVALYARVMGAHRERMWDTPHWYLDMMGVRRACQRRGFARAMAGWGIKQSQRGGCPLYVDATGDARGFYEKMGFEMLGRDVDDDCKVVIETTEGDVEIYLMLRKPDALLEGSDRQSVASAPKDPETLKWRLCYKYAKVKKYFERELKELLHWQWDEERMGVALELGQLLHMLYLVDHGPQRVATGAKDLEDTDPLWDYLDKVTFGVGMTDEELGLPVDK